MALLQIIFNSITAEYCNVHTFKQDFEGVNWIEVKS